jgi:hypothetical protein
LGGCVHLLTYVITCGIFLADFTLLCANGKLLSILRILLHGNTRKWRKYPGKANVTEPLQIQMIILCQDSRFYFEIAQMEKMMKNGHTSHPNLPPWTEICNQQISSVF